jgi:hypothetical protein
MHARAETDEEMLCHAIQGKGRCCPPCLGTPRSIVPCGFGYAPTLADTVCSLTSSRLNRKTACCRPSMPLISSMLQTTLHPAVRMQSPHQHAKRNTVHSTNHSV